MADTFKIDWFFVSGVQGWCETWYALADTPTIAMAKALAVGQLRANLLGTGAIIDKTRISDVNILGDSRFNNDQIGPRRTTDDDPTDQANAAIYAKFTSDQIYKRSFWMRGFPDNWFQRSQLFAAPNDIADRATANFNAFRDALINNRFLIRALNKTDAANRPKDVTGLAESVDHLTDVFVAGHGYGNLDEVRISGVQGDRVDGINGVHQIFNVAANSFTIPVPITAPGPNYKGGGKSTKRSVGYFEVKAGELVRASTHKTGRINFVPQGKAKSR